MTTIDKNNLSQCKSCGGEIVWCVTENGKRIPVNSEPVENGNLKLRFGRGAPLAIYVEGRSLFAPDEDERYISHFVTCPQAAEHRKS